MKKIKKFFALLIAMAMVLGMSTSVFAASITINRDDTYAGEENDAGRAYSYYKVFSVASKGEGFSQDFEGGYTEDEDGNLVPVTEQGEGKVAYTATAAVAAKLGTWDEESGTWTKATGNDWFILAPIVDSTDYSVSWDDSQDGTDPETVQDAAAWLIANSAYESGPTAMTFADGKWTAEDIDDGYYIVSGDTGNNLVAVTTDIEINEKNDYPPITKGQKEEDYPTTYVDENGDPINVAIGDEVTYQVTVTVPKAAKVGETIEVYDKITEGLTYSGGLKVTIQGQEGEVTLPDGSSYTGDEYAWDKVITVTEDNKGAVYVFDYTMTINDEALFDTGRENEAGLKYGDEYESIPKEVNFTTYFAGIEKYDGDTPATKLANVEFTLKEDGVEFLVTKTEDGYYIPVTQRIKMMLLKMQPQTHGETFLTIRVQSFLPPAASAQPSSTLLVLCS